MNVVRLNTCFHILTAYLPGGVNSLFISILFLTRSRYVSDIGGNSTDVSEDRLDDLLPGASSNIGLESTDGRLVPLTHPTPRHRGGLVGYDEETLELAAHLQRRAGGEATDGHSD